MAYDFDPVVTVERRGNQLILLECPHCGKTHYHGAGGLMDKDDYGHRTAHCVALPKQLANQRHCLGYTLVSSKRVLRTLA